VALPRLRQVAFVARELEPTAAELRRRLDLNEPYRDPGVGLFGLQNAVFALGDAFLEIVSPVQEGTSAGRYLQRQGGDAGYMAMFQVEDADAARARLAELDVRVVWEFAEPDIVDLHLHPRDVPGALVALDVCAPEGSWRWGGPAWTSRVPEFPAAGISSLTVAIRSPRVAASRWAEVLGLTAAGCSIALPSGQEVTFVDATDREGIVAAALTAPAPAGRFELAGVQIDVEPS
jgi:hypothetical protein